MLSEREVGNLIRRLRLERGYSLIELSDRVGCSKSGLQRWEKGGAYSMSLEYVCPLCKALGITPSQLIGFEK